MRAVTVKGVTLGEGAPKVIVPLTGATVTELRAEARAAVAAGPDLLEWRVDHFRDLAAPGAVVAAAEEVVGVLGGAPLLVTVRSTGEGGRRDLADGAYAALLGELLDRGLADLVDVELARPRAVTADVLAHARATGGVVVMSHHDFAATPAQEDVVALVRRMHEAGADVAKVAVMPHSARDVLTLLAATLEASGSAPGPVITVAMGTLGRLARLGGGVFGSAATFATAGRASAPGQLAVEPLRRALELLHG